MPAPVLRPTLRHSLAFFCLVMSLGLSTVTQAQDLSFTAEQVESGNALYKETCQICHGNTMMNGQFGSPLRGSFFRKKWAGKSAGELLQFTNESMPPDREQALQPEQYADLVAYILSRNKLEPSDASLPSDPSALSSVILPW